MAKKRNPRIDRAVRDAVADLVSTELTDPRLGFITFTEAQVTPDHEHAIVFYSTLDPTLISRDPRRTGGDRIPAADEVATALDNATPRLRGAVARRAKLRTTPTLRFEPDPVIEQATRVDELLRRIGSDEPDTPTDGPETDA